MKQFFKFFFASCLGILVSLALIALVFAVFVGISSQKPEISSHSVLNVNLNRALVPEKSDNVEVDLFSPNKEQAIGIHRIADLIDNAAKDSKIDGIMINASGATPGYASIEIVRDALKRFKESGKFIYSYADMYSQKGYYLASVADSLFLNPVGAVDMRGFGVQMPFMKDLLDKTGVKMNVFYAGQFKSATEPIRRNEMSEPNKLQTREYLNGLYDTYAQEIQEQRGISKSQLDQILNEFKGRTGELAVESGLIDRLAYIDEVEDQIKENTDRVGKKIRYVSLDKYNLLADIDTESGDDEIAVLIAEGTVNYGTSKKGEINETVYLKQIDKILKDDDIKAVVLRVNSGGGSALTSDIIWRGIERIKKSGRKVIASFGDYAASGGYYIAAGADTIVAQPFTLTGSIGVFGVLPNFKEVLDDKLGVHFDSLKTHDFAVAFSPFEDLSEKEARIIQDGIDRTYDLFLTRVADGRKMSKEAVHEVAQGRVWTGTKAKEKGLVDVIGDLDDAIRIAGEAIGSDDYGLKFYPRIKESFIDKMMKNIAQSETLEQTAVSLTSDEVKMIKQYKEVKNIMLDRQPQARLPFIFVEE